LHTEPAAVIPAFTDLTLKTHHFKAGITSLFVRARLWWKPQTPNWVHAYRVPAPQTKQQWGERHIFCKVQGAVTEREGRRLVLESCLFSGSAHVTVVEAGMSHCGLHEVINSQ